MHRDKSRIQQYFSKNKKDKKRNGDVGSDAESTELAKNAATGLRS